MRPRLLKLRGVSKAYSGIPALKPLSLELGEGEVLGLVGENGAGKSTLIKLLSGVCVPDCGEMEWLGNVTEFSTPDSALDAGIATIHQELAFFGQLTVAENLLLGQKWPRYSWGGIRWTELYATAAGILDQFAIPVSPQQLFSELSAAHRQEVAIARALSQNARLIILDEPTASLSEPDAARLLTHLRTFKNRGIAVLYVSHRLDEIMELTDRIIVLRDGSLVSESATSATSINQLIRDMVGRPLDQVYPHSRHKPGPIVLELSNAAFPPLFEDVTFSLRAGEIVGLAGLVGSGRSEVARAIFGLYPLQTGTMKLQGQPWRPSSPKHSLNSGLVYLPEERKRQGFVLEHSVADAVSIGFSDLLARWNLIPAAAERSRVAAVLQRYDIRAHRVDQPVGTLSGGNQQKCLLARWLDREPDVLLLDEPTRGVDVGAKAEIHALIDRLAGMGKAVLLISSDLPEVMGMSDRVLVMHAGRIANELRGSSLTQENVLLAASGYAQTPEKGGL